MFENMSEDEARKRILEITGEYCDVYHNNNNPFEEGNRIAYSARVYDHEEMINLIDSSLDFWLTAGRYTDEFEKKFSEYLGVQFCALVNSGSSANLLAFMALTSPMLGERAVKRGDEVITVAAGFPTTISPIIQFGAVPVFVDITIPQYNIDVAQLEAAYTAKTKAVMLAHTLGNPFDVVAVKAFCDAHDLWLIEDNCDSLGSEVAVNGQMRRTGTVGDIGTSSFYPPHHMTMGEGGAVYTNDITLNKIVRSLRDWGRDCVCPPGQDNHCGHRYEGQYGQLPEGYDHKYVYSHFGYNMKATDMQAAIGCAQLDKLPSFISSRKKNFDSLKDHLSEIVDKVILPEACPGANPSWFGFLITCKPGISRNKVVEYIEAHNIQTRMLFAGNMIMHPCFDGMRQQPDSYRVVGDLQNTNGVMNNSFWVGVYPGMTKDKIVYIANVIKDAVNQ
jgi:CDP-4-dehydro-6-deoxyglucose reductase, E1